MQMQHVREHGQAMVEMIFVAIPLLLLAAMSVSAIFLVRARSHATAAAYACATFLSQARDPARAAAQAQRVAERILYGDWTAAGVSYQVGVSASGGYRVCTVRWRARIPLAALLEAPGWTEGEAFFIAAPERWKGRW